MVLLQLACYCKGSLIHYREVRPEVSNLTSLEIILARVLQSSTSLSEKMEAEMMMETDNVDGLHDKEDGNAIVL